MPRDLRILLGDVQAAIGKIQQFLGRLDFEEFQHDDLRISAVEMQFVLIAEALRRLERISQQVHDRVDELRQIVDFRNVLVHEYEHADLRTLWGAAAEELPLLKQQIDAWAAELGMEAPPATAS